MSMFLVYILLSSVSCILLSASQVKVKCVTGKIYVVDVKQEDTVLTLKRRLIKHVFRTPSNQKLVYQRKLLNDDQLVKDIYSSNIPNGEYIYFACRMGPVNYSELNEELAAIGQSLSEPESEKPEFEKNNNPPKISGGFFNKINLRYIFGALGVTALVGFIIIHKMILQSNDEEEA